MNPTAMRKVDIWAGVPLCFLLTLFHRLQRILGFNDPNFDEKPRSVLFIELIEMGTTVVALPALQEFKRRYPEAKLYFLMFEEIRSTMELVDAVPRENIITIDSSSLLSLIRDTFRFVWKAHNLGIDTTVNLQMFVRYSTILSFLSGAEKRVGFHRFTQEGLYTGDLLTHKVPYNPHVHTLFMFYALVNALESPRDQVPCVKYSLSGEVLKMPKIHTGTKEREELWQMMSRENGAVKAGQKLVVVNPNASRMFGMRRLPLESYAWLVEKILEDEEVCVAISGVSSERPDAEFICSHVSSDRVVDLTGKTTLRQLIDLFNLARVLVTNDSGPAHFAALTDVHVVVFFGPELPDRYRPVTEKCTVVYSHFLCSPCVSPFNQRDTPCNDNLCMKSIDLGAVHTTVMGLLRDGRVENNEPMG